MLSPCCFIAACLANSVRLVTPGVEVLGQDSDVGGETVGSSSHQYIVLQSCSVSQSVSATRGGEHFFHRKVQEK